MVGKAAWLGSLEDVQQNEGVKQLRLHTPDEASDLGSEAFLDLRGRPDLEICIFHSG